MTPRAVAITRRAETEADAPFLFALFRSSRPPAEQLPSLDPALRGMLMRQQFAGQTMTYRAHYPAAAFDIIEQDGVPIGRIVVETAADAILIVDIALLSEWRGRGIGLHVISTILAEAQAAAKPVFLSVFTSNTDALRLYCRLGFEISSTSEIEIRMVWRPRSA